MQHSNITPMMFCLGGIAVELYGVMGVGARVCNSATLPRELFQSRVAELQVAGEIVWRRAGSWVECVLFVFYILLLWDFIR